MLNYAVHDVVPSGICLTFKTIHGVYFGLLMQEGLHSMGGHINRSISFTFESTAEFDYGLLRITSFDSMARPKHTAFPSKLHSTGFQQVSGLRP